MQQNYIDEVKQIKQNCEYNAETHHVIAIRNKKFSLWLQVIPAIVAAITGALVAAGKSPTSLLVLTVLSSVIAAVASILDPNKNYQDHLSAAKNFTVLKHEARSLYETFGTRMTDEAFAVAVENIHRRYTDLIKMVPPTDDEAFMKAREKIQKRIHEPDKDEGGIIL